MKGPFYRRLRHVRFTRSPLGLIAHRSPARPACRDEFRWRSLGQFYFSTMRQGVPRMFSLDHARAPARLRFLGYMTGRTPAAPLFHCACLWTNMSPRIRWPGAGASCLAGVDELFELLVGLENATLDQRQLKLAMDTPVVLREGARVWPKAFCRVDVATVADDQTYFVDRTAACPRHRFCLRSRPARLTGVSKLLSR